MLEIVHAAMSQYLNSKCPNPGLKKIQFASANFLIYADIKSNCEYDSICFQSCITSTKIKKNYQFKLVPLYYRNTDKMQKKKGHFDD